jgi:hypothetical protein
MEMDTAGDILLQCLLQGATPAFAPDPRVHPDLEHLGAAMCQTFLWLAIRGRHWTADRRHRHGLDARDECYLCDQEPESIDHIISSCSFSRHIWWTILAVLGVNASQVGGGSVIDWWEHWRRRWHGDKRKGADTLFALVAWELWKERKARLFRNEAANIAQFLAKIKHIADLWIDAGARHLGEVVRE